MEKVQKKEKEKNAIMIFRNDERDNQFRGIWKVSMG